MRELSALMAGVRGEPIAIDQGSQKENGRFGSNRIHFAMSAAL
jgi:hypothetical protein